MLLPTLNMEADPFALHNLKHFVQISSRMFDPRPCEIKLKSKVNCRNFPVTAISVYVEGSTSELSEMYLIFNS